MEAKGREQCKIRKRGNSSSSSSSVIQKYRFKRAILVGKRGGGSTTPVPTWITTSKSPTLAMPASEITQSGAKTKEVSVSARKLAATLWENNQIPSPKLHKTALEDKKEVRSREKFAKLPHLSDPISEKVDRPARGNGHRRRSSSGRKKLVHLTDCNVDSVVGDAALMEIETHTKSKTFMEYASGTKTRLKEISNGLTTSKELLKVLSRIWGHDQHHSSGISLVSALRVEIDRARTQVDELIKDHRSNRNEIEYLVKHFEEEKALWRSKERDRIRNGIACVAEELEVEKKLRRQTERLNKKLGKELADMKASFSKAVKELDSEKRAKEILEQVCDELARGIGEDRAEVEELKRESEKVKEEVEKEREMLQLADVLREERVQMKLSEAKYHFEEKNEAVERLRNELEAFLREKVVDKENGDGSPSYEKIKELEAYLKEIQIGSYQKVEADDISNGEVHDEVDSADSDLHSIELNMDNNSRSYKWSYASEGLIGKNQECLDMFSREPLSELGLHSQTQDHEDDIERYRSVQSLRDHILSGSKRTLIQNFSSPTRRWGQSLPMENPDNEVSGSSPVLQVDEFKASGNESQVLTSSRY